MRCPRCRKWIDFEAVEHAACGWRAGSVPPGSPEERHAKEDAVRATEEQREVHMKKIREILGTAVPKRRRLSSQEQHGGGKLSAEEEAFRRELAAKRAARLERLRRSVS